MRLFNILTLLQEALQAVNPTGSFRHANTVARDDGGCCFVEISLSCITWKLFIFSLSTYEYLSKHGNSAVQHLRLQALGWPS